MMSKITSVFALAASAIAATLPENLNGPNKGDKIAIIGAGPAGIHMAHLLKQEGFEKVIVFEADDVIGGKTKAFDIDEDELPEGVRLDSGGVYLPDNVTYARTHELINLVGLSDKIADVGQSHVIDNVLQAGIEAQLAALGVPVESDEPMLFDFATWLVGRAIGSAPQADQDSFAAQWVNFCTVINADNGCSLNVPSSQNPFYQSFAQLYIGTVTSAYQAAVGGLTAGDARYAAYGFPTENPITKPLLSMSIGSFLSLPLSTFDSDHPSGLSFAQLVSAGVQAEYGFPLEIVSLNFMRPIFEIYMTLQGYGQIDVTPTYYGITWITPAFISLAQSRLSGVPLEPTQTVTMLKTGFGSIFEELVAQQSIDVRVGTKVKRIRKINPNNYNGGRFRIVTDSKYRRNGSLRKNVLKNKKFIADFVISAVDQGVFQKFLRGQQLADVNQTLFDINANAIRNSWRVTDAKVYRDEGVPTYTYNASTINEAIGGLYQGGNGKLANTVAILDQIETKSGVSSFTEEGRDMVIYELNPDAEAEPSIGPGFELRNVRSTIVHENYFARFNDFTTSSPWDYLAIQGHSDIWFVGASVSFESIETVLGYNDMIVNTWKQGSDYNL